MPEDPTAAQHALAADPGLAAALAFRGARWEPLRNVGRVAGPEAGRVLAASGGPPCVLWFGDGGQVLRVTKAPTAARVVGDLSAIRSGTSNR
jgi:hypothetical protein